MKANEPNTGNTELLQHRMLEQLGTESLAEAAAVVDQSIEQLTQSIVSRLC